MLQEGALRQDFRFRGFPNQSMQSPRHPITSTISEDKKRNEENFLRVFGRPFIFDPASPGVDQARRKVEFDNNNQTDNCFSNRIDMKETGHPKSPEEERKLRLLQLEAEEDIRKFRQEKMLQNLHEAEERNRERELQNKYYPWDRLNRGHGAPKADNDNRRRRFWENSGSQEGITHTKEPHKVQRGHDLFIDTLGGPGGTVVRHDGGPGLQSMPDPRLGAYRSPAPGGRGRESEVAEQENRIREQRQKIEELKKEIDCLKSPRGQQANQATFGATNPDRYQPSQNGYNPSFGATDYPSTRVPFSFDIDQPRQEEKRSLDLDATRGGAGAPMRDERGRVITRLPVTMERDDHGTTKIQERIPGKKYNLPDEPIYDPFGKPGGGAPVMDRYGNRNTHTFGNFEKKTDAAEHTKRVRAKEVMLNDLRVGIEEQQRNKEEMRRYEKEPHGELAEVIRSKEVGHPKRDPITGTLANQHLPNSDVSRLKMNYQPVDELEKRNLNNFLREQIEENERSKHLERLRSVQESNKHFDQFDQRWGSYGGGAPKDRVIRKKVNLDNALYYYDRETRSEEAQRHRDFQYKGPQPGSQEVSSSYQKPNFEADIRHRSPDVTPRYVKNSTLSTSSNLYEYPTDKPARPMQKASAPWATNSAFAY